MDFGDFNDDSVKDSSIGNVNAKFQQADDFANEMYDLHKALNAEAKVIVGTPINDDYFIEPIDLEITPPENTWEKPADPKDIQYELAEIRLESSTDLKDEEFTPDVTIPVFDAIKPELDIPSFPSCIAPTKDVGAKPTAPSTGLPDRDAGISVTAPDCTIPEMPVGVTPSKPELLSAITPDVSLPTKPDTTLPETPDTTLPDAPGSAPAIVSPDMPSAPDITIEAPPVIPDIVIPAMPEFTVTPFEGTPPVMNLTPPTGTFEYVEEEYNSDFGDALKAIIETGIAGDALGISTSTMATILDSKIARADQIRDKAYTEASDYFASRGHSLPPGALQARLTQIDKEFLDSTTNANADITMHQMDLTSQYTQLCIQSGVKFEENLMTQADRIATRAFELAKASVEMEIQIFNANVAYLNAGLEVYKTEAAVYAEEIKGSLLVLEGYKAQLEGVSLGIEAQKSKIEVYSMQLQTEKYKIEMYNAQINAANSIFETEKLKLEAHMALITEYQAKIQAKTAEYSMYNSQVQATVAGYGMYTEQLRAKEAEYGIYTAQQQLNIATNDVYKSQLQAKSGEYATQQANLQTKAAEYGAYNTELQASITEDEVYKSKIDLKGKEYDLFLSEMKGRESEFECYKTEMQTKAAEYGMYESKVNGEVAKASLYEGEVKAFTGQVQAYSADVQRVIAEYQNQQEINKGIIADNSNKLTKFTTEYQVEMSKFQGAIEELKGEVEMYKTRVGIENTKLNADLTVYTTEAENNFKQAEVDLKRADMNVRAMMQDYEMKFKLLETELQVTAQAIASSLTSVNATAAIGYDGGYNITYHHDKTKQEPSGKTVTESHIFYET